MARRGLEPSGYHGGMNDADYGGGIPGGGAAGDAAPPGGAGGGDQQPDPLPSGGGLNITGTAFGSDGRMSSSNRLPSGMSGGLYGRARGGAGRARTDDDDEEEEEDDESDESAADGVAGGGGGQQPQQQHGGRLNDIDGDSTRSLNGHGGEGTGPTPEGEASRRRGDDGKAAGTGDGARHQAAEEASRALSRLQIQGTQRRANGDVAPQSPQPAEGGGSARDAAAGDIVALGTELRNATPSPSQQQLQPYGCRVVDRRPSSSGDLAAPPGTSGDDMALTVLPENRISTTTADAAAAADTFADMMSAGAGLGPGGYCHGMDGGVYMHGSEFDGRAGEAPGLVVDGSGVVRRPGSVRTADGSAPPSPTGPGLPVPGGRAGARPPGGAAGQLPGRGIGGGLHRVPDGPHRGHPHGPGRHPTGADASPDDDADDDDAVDDDDDSSEISASDEDGSWIAWFCNLRGNEFFCEVDEDYIQDDFNLTGLNGLVPYYDYALDMVLDVEMPMEDGLTEEQQEIVESAAEMLYGLIHARYVVTNRGMHAMYEKYRSASFGRCPQVFCQGQPVLPVGLSDLPRNYTVNVFCPRCHGLYFPKSTRQANIDGAYFGTTFPHLYLMTHPEMVPSRPSQSYVPRVYGFRISRTSLYFRNHDEDHGEGGRREGNRSDGQKGRRGGMVARGRQGGGMRR